MLPVYVLGLRRSWPTHARAFWSHRCWPTAARRQHDCRAAVPQLVAGCPRASDVGIGRPPS